MQRSVSEEGLIVAIVWPHAESKLARSLDCSGHCFSLISFKSAERQFVVTKKNIWQIIFGGEYLAGNN